MKAYSMFLQTGGCVKSSPHPLSLFMSRNKAQPAERLAGPLRQSNIFVTMNSYRIRTADVYFHYNSDWTFISSVTFNNIVTVVPKTGQASHNGKTGSKEVTQSLPITHFWLTCSQ